MYQLWSLKGWEGHFPKSESIHKEPWKSLRKKKRGKLSTVNLEVFLVPKIIKSDQTFLSFYTNQSC